MYYLLVETCRESNTEISMTSSCLRIIIVLYVGWAVKSSSCLSPVWPTVFVFYRQCSDFAVRYNFAPCCRCDSISNESFNGELKSLLSATGVDNTVHFALKLYYLSVSGGLRSTMDAIFPDDQSEVMILRPAIPIKSINNYAAEAES